MNNETFPISRGELESLRLRLKEANELVEPLTRENDRLKAANVRMAERVAELEYACDIGRETIEAKDAQIANLQTQLAAALATIERAVGATEVVDTGAMYAEGCAP